MKGLALDGGFDKRLYLITKSIRKQYDKLMVSKPSSVL